MTKDRQMWLAAIGFALALLGLLIFLGYMLSPHHGDVSTIEAGQWSCVTVYLNGEWQWPPICQPQATP